MGDSAEISCHILTTTDNKEIGEISYDNVQKSINGFHRQINALINSEYTDEDLESAKRMLKSSLLNKEGVPAKLTRLIGGKNSASSIDKENQVYEAIDTVTSEDIQKMAENIFSSHPIYSIVASKDTLEFNKGFTLKEAILSPTSSTIPYGDLI